MINVYTVPWELTAPKFADAFAAGVRGTKAIIREDYKPGIWAGFGSPETWEGLQETIAAGFDWYYGDHAYFGRRQFFRVTKNAYQHDGIGEPNYLRLRHWYQREKPWKIGRRVIVCPQSAPYHERVGCPNWLEETLAVLRASTDREIVIRTKNTLQPIEEDLQDAWCVVTHASNAAVVALMEGVPAICTGACAASRMSRANPAEIENPIYPDGRLEWAAVLAANQWTLGEIARGKAWKAIR